MNNQSAGRTERRHEFLEIRLINEQSTRGLTDDQLFAFKMYQTGKNMVIVGNAGSGKSYLVDTIRKHALSMQRRVYVAGTTGISVVNVQGDATMHSMFGLGLGIDPKDNRPVYDQVMDVVNRGKSSTFVGRRFAKSKSILIIDEISMGDALTVWMALEVAKYWIGPQNLQVILVGDPLQLPPVSGLFFWESIRFQRATYDLMKDYDFHVVQLNEPVRQKGHDEFIQALNQLRVGEIHPLIVERYQAQLPADLRPLHIYFNNVSVVEYNNQVARELKAQGASAKIFKGRYVGNERKGWLKDLSPIEEDMELVIGQKFMFRRNGQYLIRNSSAGSRWIANGNIGVIREFIRTQDPNGTECDGILVQLRDETLVEVAPIKINGPKGSDGEPIGVLTQLPGHPAECITGHKAQGLTIDGPIVVHAWQLRYKREQPISTPAWLYVVCSRVTKPQYLFFDNETGQMGLRQLMSGVIANEAAIEWLGIKDEDQETQQGVEQQ